MNCEPKFLRCVDCSTLVEALNEQCCDELSCCGKPMDLLIPNHNAGADGEKHLPVAWWEDGALIVKIGRILHPMSQQHHIEWVCVQNKYETHRIRLKRGEDPILHIPLAPSAAPVTIYTYCNRHGLWKAQVQR
jgi:superoxide reductase